MDSRVVLKWHIRVFKMCGLWPSENGSVLYNIWMIFFISTVIIGFPVSQLISVFYVDSVHAAVDLLVTTSSIVMAAIKGLNVLANRKTFSELLHLMEQLDETISHEGHVKVFKQKFRTSNRLLALFCVSYIGSWIFLAFQVIMSDPQQRLWPSTYLYPNEYLQQHSIYLGGIIFQSISNLFIVFVDIVVDTYGAALLCVLGGHIEILGQRLQKLGDGCKDYDDYCQEEGVLVELCEKYLLMIRYAELTENILSFALFSQFGVSGLVLCTCAYQLSVVNPSDDLFKFLFAILYSFAMITEILIPSYFGSDVLVKSEKLSYDIFISNWISAPKKYKRSMLILIERTRKPITIFAASIFMLNLFTLLKILKTAYSLFALLKNA